jgi:hypothetical protein
MNDRSVRIAVCVKDRVARQLTCSMFSAAGATTQVCDDTAAIEQVGDDLQAIVLGLSSTPDETLDAVVALRQSRPTVPVYVIADAAGQRHAKRVKSFGVSEVIPHGELQRRAGPLVQRLAPGDRVDDPGPRSPGWAATKDDPGYDVHSMDLNAWLAVPGNRRLLGNYEPFGAATPPPPDGTAAVDQRDSGTRDPRTAPGVAPAPTPPLAAPPSASPPVGATPPLAAPPGAASPITAAPQPGSEAASCGQTQCTHLLQCRAEHQAQNVSILEAHKQRERRIETEIKGELYQAMTVRIAASEAQVQQGLDEGAAALRRELAAAMRRIYLMLAAIVGAAAIAGIGLGWRLGTW